MTSMLREKIQSDLITAPWKDLKDLIVRNKAFEVQGESLVEVGYAIATDNISEVQNWLESGVLSQFDLVKVKPNEQLYTLLIIQPYVLIQKLEES